MAKKNKKSGSIAVPFLVTIFVGLLVVGGVAFGIYQYFGLGNKNELEEPLPRAVATSTEEDNHTILFVLDEPDEKCSATFVLMRSRPKDKSLLFIGVPTNTIAVIDGKQQRLQHQYDRAGAAAAANFVQAVFDVPVDRYVKLTSPALIKLCDIFGGVSYPVNVEIAGFHSDGTNQYLNSEQIEKLITYSLFPDGEVQRAYTASSIAADMMNQADGKRIADNFDNNFSTIINMTESNITSVDYKNRKAAIKSMFERGSTIGSFLIMNGDVAGEDFIPSKKFLEDVKKTYFTESEE